MGLLSAVLDLLYPPRCVFCRRIMRSSAERVCPDCARTLPYAGARGERHGDFFSVCLIPIAWIVVDSDIVTVFCKTFCDTSTDALRCTGNQCGCHRRNHPFCVSYLSVEQRFSLSHHFLNDFCTRLHIVYHAGNQTAQERAFFDVAVHNCLSQ